MKSHAMCVMLLAAVFLMTAMPVLAQEEGGLTLSVSKQMGYNMGSQIQGTFKMKVRGPENLVSVTFRIDGETIGEVEAAPYEFRFQTGDYSPGWHEVDAIGTTMDGKTLASKLLRFQFVSSETATQGMVRIIVPVLVLVFGALAASALVPLLSGRKSRSYEPGDDSSNAPRSYGILGGTVCPKCGRPFSLHWWGLNVTLAGKFDRCPYCGKWSLVRRAGREDLMAAEAAESAAHALSAPRLESSEEEKLREQVEDSRYTTL